MKVMAFGTFDGFHPGHVFYLQEAKKHGYLIVVVARDETVKKIKGKAPRRSMVERIGQVKGSGIADEVVAGDRTDYYKLIEEFKPDVLCFGYDQKSFNVNIKTEMAKRGMNPNIVYVPAFRSDQYKSSLLNKGK